MNPTRRSTLLSLSSLLVALAAAPARASAFLRPPSPDEVQEFLAAVRAGRMDEVRKLLERTPALARARDAGGLSAYLVAHLAGHAEIADLLRESGIELDVVECVFAEDWPRFESLIRAHPELANALHPIGGTPLHAGALAGSLHLYRVRGQGCRWDEIPAGGNGFTPARTAMDCPDPIGALIAATDLLSNGADVNAAQAHGDSVLHAAVRRRSEVLVRLAVRKGALVDARDDQGRTPRALALELGWEAGVTLLDGHAALVRDCRRSRFAFDATFQPVVRADLSDVPQAEQSRVTSNSHGNLEVVQECLQRDPRLTFSISTDQELAIEASAHVGNRDILRLHLEHGAPLSLPSAVSLGDEAAVQRLLDWEPLLVHERGAHDFAVMHYVALGGGGPALAERLLARGVGVDQESRGVTALHLCVRRDDLELARWLLEHDCAREPVGYLWKREGETPLALARSLGHSRMAALLVDAGARV